MGSKFHELLSPVEARGRDLARRAVAIDGTAWLHQFLKVTLHNIIDEERTRFMTPDVNEQAGDVEWRTVDSDSVRQFLLEHHSFSPGLVEKALAGLANAMS